MFFIFPKAVISKGPFKDPDTQHFWNSMVQTPATMSGTVVGDNQAEAVKEAEEEERAKWSLIHGLCAS